MSAKEGINAGTNIGGYYCVDHTESEGDWQHCSCAFGYNKQCAECASYQSGNETPNYPVPAIIYDVEWWPEPRVFEVHSIGCID